MNNTLDESEEEGGREEEEVKVQQEKEEEGTERDRELQALEQIRKEQELALNTVRRYPGVYGRSSTPPRKIRKDSLEKHPNIYICESINATEKS